MIEPIVIKVTDKVPEIISGPEYVVCDNSDYTVVWQLDEEWAQFEHRTMQVNYKDGTYERVLFTGDTCALPAIPVPGPVHVGLFAGDIHTTRPARLLAVRSATTDSGEERDPMPNGYAQAIEALDAKLDKNQGADNAGKALVVDDDGNVVPGEAQGGGGAETDPTVPAWAKQPTKPTYTAEEVGADASGAAAGAVSAHNTAADAHSDIRLLVEGLTTRLNALANSDDTTLDQMAEVVAYIKDNRELIESVTTDKVNVSDIINNLTTNASNKPLSAAQGVALKALIDALAGKATEWDEKYAKPSGGIPKTDLARDVQASLSKADNALAQNDLQAATNATLAQAKASGEFDGANGKDGVDGTTPHIGTNGNWYLGETDTGKPSRGEQGPGAEVFYIDLAGNDPDYTCPVAMADIKAAYEAGKVLECRCTIGGYPATLPLFVPIPSANTWVFSGSGALEDMGFPAQTFTVAIASPGVRVRNAKLATMDDKLPNPESLTITSGSTTVTYDGSTEESIDIPAGVGDDTPDYVLTAADALATKVVNHIGSDNILFAVMADAHLGYYTDTENAAGRQAGQALKRLNERCALDFVAHVGDYTTGAYNTTVESAMRDMADYQLLIGSKFPGRQTWCVGNHDDAPYQVTANRMSQTQVYAAISRKNLVSNGYVPGNTGYGYMDFPALRLRLIYLDTHDRRGWNSAQVGVGENCDFLNVENIGAVQLQWLADHALDFSGVDDPSKWSILIFSHAVLGTSGTYTDPGPGGMVHPCNTANAAKLLKAYATKKSGSITHGGVAVNYNFTAVAPAGIIGCIHGHEHRYANETVGGAFLSICCPNILNGRERVSADGNTYTKTAGTANGTSFCVFSINRADKKIYVDHYGPGVDRVFDYTVIDPSAPSYTNVLPSAIDTDGSIYNGVGWKEGYRLTSSGALEGESGSYITGFIPIKFGDVVHLKNVKWQNGVTTGLNSGNQRISFYDANKAHLGQANAVGLGGMLSGVKDANNIWTQFTVKNWSGVDVGSAAYFRLNCAEISGDSIITVNEEIT